MAMGVVMAALAIRQDYEPADLRRRAAREGDRRAALRLLAIAQAHLGQLADARAAGRRVLELSPNYTIGEARAGMFFRDPRHAEIYLEGLRLAGLPE